VLRCFPFRCRSRFPFRCRSPVDASSIEVNRRRKHAKTDLIDAGKLLVLLCRCHGGERKVWGVVRVPAVEDEDRRQLRRGLKDLQRQRTECSNRIKGLLASVELSKEEFRYLIAVICVLRGHAGPGELLVNLRVISGSCPKCGASVWPQEIKDSGY
jgi:hypothetical protein